MDVVGYQQDLRQPVLLGREKMLLVLEFSQEKILQYLQFFHLEWRVCRLCSSGNVAWTGPHTIRQHCEVPKCGVVMVFDGLGILYQGVPMDVS